MKLEGRVALITGAAGGIGAAIAQRFLDRGARLVLVDRDPIRLEQLNAALSARYPGKIRSHSIDLTDDAALEQLARSLGDSPWPIDVLVNNAGILRLGGPLESSLRDWDALYQTNLRAAVHTTELFVPAMLRRKSGAVVNIASAAGKVGVPAMTAYSAMKFALLGYSQSLHASLRSQGIQVHCICPGLVRTSLLHSAELDEVTLQQMDERLQKRGVDPVRVARAVTQALSGDRFMLDVGADAHGVSLAVGLLPWHAHRLIHRLTGRQ